MLDAKEKVLLFIPDRHFSHKWRSCFILAAVNPKMRNVMTIGISPLSGGVASACCVCLQRPPVHMYQRRDTA